MNENTISCQELFYKDYKISYMNENTISCQELFYKDYKISYMNDFQDY